MSTHLKTILQALVIGMILLAFSEQSALADDSGTTDDTPDFLVTLLGTGTPAPSHQRFGMSTLVQAGGKNLLFDAGRGVGIRLWQMGMTRADLDATFMTHMHSDHWVGMVDLFQTDWIFDSLLGYDPKPFTIYGPKAIKGRPGTKETMQRLKKTFQADTYIRHNDEDYPFEDRVINAHDIAGPKMIYDIDGNQVVNKDAQTDKNVEVIYDEDGVKVSVFSVYHGTYIQPAFGYRVDYDGRSVLISGDTTYSPDEFLLTAAQGVDVLIHEVAALGPKFQSGGAGAAIKAHHSTPEQAGKVFAGIQPRLAVYSHIVIDAKEKKNRPTIQSIKKRTRKTYDGPLLVGSDLTQIAIGKDDVSVYRPQEKLTVSAPAIVSGPHPHTN